MHSCHAPPTLNVCFYHYYTFALLFLHFIFLFCPGVGGQQLGPGMEPPAVRWVLAQPRLPGGGAQINALTGQHRCWWGLWSLAAMGWVPPLHPFCAAVGAPIPASRNSLRAFTSPPSPLLSRCPPPRLALLSPLLSSRPHPVPCLSHLTSMPQRPTAPPPSPVPPTIPRPSGSSGFACGFYCASVASHVWGSGGARPGPPSSRFPAPGPPHWPLPSSPGRAVRPVRCIPSTGSCKRPWGGGSGWAPGGLL